jgi:hypothetical protein
MPTKRSRLDWLADRIPRRYIVVSVAGDPRGARCTMPPDAFADFRDGSDPADYTVRTVWRSRRWYQSLGDFNGF